MGKKVLFPDEVARVLYDIVKNKHMNKSLKIFLILLLCIFIFGLISLLFIVGIISLIKHISNYEVLMGVICTTYSLFFTVNFIKEFYYMRKNK